MFQNILNFSVRKNKIYYFDLPKIRLFPLLHANILIWITSCSNPGQYPIGAEFVPYVFRSGDNGDNWCLTWAADGKSMYMVFSDCTQDYTIHYKWNMQEFRLIFEND